MQSYYAVILVHKYDIKPPTLSMSSINYPWVLLFLVGFWIHIISELFLLKYPFFFIQLLWSCGRLYYPWMLLLLVDSWFLDSISFLNLFFSFCGGGQPLSIIPDCCCFSCFSQFFLLKYNFFQLLWRGPACCRGAVKN